MEIKKNKFVRFVYYTYRNWLDKHSYNHGRGNRITVDGTKIHSKIQINGNNNALIVKEMGVVKNTLFHIAGNNNKIIISEGAFVLGAELWIEDDGCTIEIGKKSFVGHHSHFACTENGSRLTIGDDCMISSYVQVRTGDSHSILDMEGKRINPAKSVHVGNHCWIGEGAKVLKGVTLDHDVIVSTGAVVTKSFDCNVLLGGIPAKVLKENVTWDSKRL